MFRLSGRVDIYDVQRLRMEPGWRVSPLAHNFLELNYVLSGRVYIRAGRRTTIAEAGDIVLCPPGVLHKGWTDKDQPLETVWIPFGGGFQGQAPRRLVVHHDARGRIAELVQWMLDNQAEDSLGLQAEQETFLRAILLDFERREGGAHARPEWIMRVHEHIRQHLAEALTVETLARIAGLSRSRFLHAYKQIMRVTPMADVRAMRLHKARHLLISTELPLKAIAEQTGLGDVYSMSHCFRRNLGAAPGSFRHAART